MPRPSAGDDIPLARRSSPPRQRRSWFVRLLRLQVLVVAVVVVVLALLLGPLRPWITPPPVPGLNARLSADGRLLGHFPYPEAPGSELVAVEPGHQLRSDAAGAFQAMRRSAAEAGIDLVLLSAFRPVDVQRRLFFEVGAERNQTAQMRARVSAPPGFSEHSTGYAVDVGDASAPDTNLSASFADTPAFAWMQAHAARFHFRLSFPRGNRQGVTYEPWHWRYEGSTTALRLFEPAARLAVSGEGR
ncbi:MAG: M15 family metallopeptidase [Synechococcaceae cyanobacterium]|nr:M15 family metallopeptidase [Synechococcaceae cyanobacterium]